MEDAKNSFPGKGHLKAEEEETRRLKKELAHVTMEGDILKKQWPFFQRIHSEV